MKGLIVIYTISFIGHCDRIIQRRIAGIFTDPKEAEKVYASLWKKGYPLSVSFHLLDDRGFADSLPTVAVEKLPEVAEIMEEYSRQIDWEAAVAQGEATISELFDQFMAG
jgi:hypothetical protein